MVENQGADQKSPAMPGHAVPCRPVPCRPVPCRAVRAIDKWWRIRGLIRRALPCGVMLCHAVPYRAILYHAVPLELLTSGGESGG